MNLFKKITQEVKVFGSTKELIEQIHNEFNGAGEQLLKEANEILNNSNFSTEKADTLAKLGFRNVPELKEVQEKINKKRLADKTVQLVQRYAMSYPNQKFITEEMVKEICSRYNLVYGDVSRYKGFVPLHNLKQIEAFTLKEEDIMYAKTRRSSWRYDDVEYITKKEYDHFYNDGITSQFYNRTIANTGLVICAPLKDMDIEGMEVKDFKLTKMEVPDPVVLKQVTGGYLILTAWRDEASDPIVVNERNN